MTDREREAGAMGTHRRRPDDRAKWVFNRIAASDVHRKHPAQHPWRAAIPYVLVAIVILAVGAAAILSLAAKG